MFVPGTWDTELSSMQSSGLQSDQGIYPSNSKFAQEAQTGADWVSDKVTQVSYSLSPF